MNGNNKSLFHISSYQYFIYVTVFQQVPLTFFFFGCIKISIAFRVILHRCLVKIYLFFLTVQLQLVKPLILLSLFIFYRKPCSLLSSTMFYACLCILKYCALMLDSHIKPELPYIDVSLKGEYIKDHPFSKLLSCYSKPLPY